MRATTLIVATALLGGCQGTFSMQDDDRFMMPDDDTGVIPTPACPADPDCAIGGDCSLYVCPDYFICEDAADGTKICIGPGPEFPDDGGGWACEDIDGRTVCRRPGSTLPDDGGGSGWVCELQAEFVVCTDDTPSYPDDGGDATYDCYYRNEFRICEDRPGDGGGWYCHDTETGRSCRRDDPDYPDDRDWTCYDHEGTTTCQVPGSDLPDGGGGSGWVCESQGDLVVCEDDTPDYPDDGGGGSWDCTFGDEFRVCDDGGDVPDGGGGVCVPGTQRWCDDAIYCSWGKQTCNPDGSWGPCVEPTVTRDGLTDRPATECGCRFFYFNDDCCEDQADRNADGVPDCIIPSDHAPPACPSDGSLCSSCDSHNDCGGDADLCIFRRDGYAMCAQDCSTTPCPGGYTCQAVGTSAGTVHQCVPDSGGCE
jgi:hypothetical protein